MGKKRGETGREREKQMPLVRPDAFRDQQTKLHGDGPILQFPVMLGFPPKKHILLLQTAKTINMPII